MKNSIIALLTLFGGIHSSQGQNNLHKGKEFWLGFMDRVSSVTLLIEVSCDKNTNGTVSIPTTAYMQNFSVSANSILELTVPLASAMVTTSEVVENKGVYILANDSINVIAYSVQFQATDATNVMPAQLLGNDYLIMSYPRSPIAGSASKSEFLIVATQDNTNIDINLSDSTIGGTPPGLFSIQLQEGEAYQVKSNGDLTGTEINATNPVAVFAGNVCTTIQIDKCCCDHLFNQLPPTTNWGTEFIATPLMTRSNGDTYRIMALSNNTQVTINGGAPFPLNKGEFVEQIIVNASIIQATQFICVAQFSHSASYDGTNYGDPFMMMLNPVDQTISSALFRANSGGNNNIQSHFLNIITETSNVNQIELDSVPVSAGLFSAIPSSSYSYATLAISNDTHLLSTSGQMIAYTYGFGIYESYGYSIGDLGKGNNVGLENSSNQKRRITIHPNPTTGTFTVANATGEIQVYDLFGRKVLESKEPEIDMSSFPAGLYIWRVGEARGMLVIE